MRRRTVLAAGGCLLSAASAGCLETLRREDAWRELVVDPPDEVYVPPHADGMVTYGTATADGREIALLASRPHSFWPVAGDERSRADIRSRHALHLMVDVRDTETGAIIPSPVTAAIRRRDGAAEDGGLVDRRSLWPMLSQRMGPHYGDNVPLEGDGTYSATIRIGATSADAVGALADGLEEPTTVDLEFEYEAAEIEGLERRLIDEDEGRGDPDALEPMADRGGERVESAFDGERVTRVGSETNDGIVSTAAFVESDRNGTAALVVALRTAHNRYPLPFASLSATVSRAGEGIAGGSLQETIDPRYGHHYRTSIDPGDFERGDELSITLETPPQLARHEGYETAFLERNTVTIPFDG
ncbi:iron transporter [Natronorubrum halophilum]|uniref:iron transporter n=1 Tax=Natronorubrum halophilum TaxID=1702106 RepID=UPI000EF67BB3|nr:iron transporter [Natronorubrum halophilum]